MGRSRYRRTIAVGALASVLTLVTSLAARGAPAQDAPAFANGRGSAVAQVARWAPGVGSLQIGITSGQSIAQIQNNLAQAQAQSLDLGLIGTSLTTEQCNGDAAPFTPEQLPHPTQVDNRSGDSTASEDQFGGAGSTIGAGHQAASASTTPTADASVSGVQTGLGPLATISNGRSATRSGVVGGKAREAEATVSVDLDIAGVVQLHDAQWRAFHRTGDSPSTAGTFDVASATIGNLPYPTDQAAPLQDAINAALAPSGVAIEMPHMEHLTSPNELVRVTPLRIIMKDSPAGKTVVGPGLNLTRAQRSQLFDAIVGVYCKLASELLVGDVTLSVLSGTGFMIVDVGGAEASTADPINGNPFGTESPFGSVNDPPIVDGSTPAALAATGVVEAPATVAARPASESGPFADICESLHPTRKPLCSRGMGVPIGVAGLIVTSGIGYLDWRRQRRLASDASAAVTQ